MKARLSDRELDTLLAGLPRESASPGFSMRVLANLDAPQRRRPGSGWLLAAAATVAALIAGLWLLPRTQPAPPLAETGALEREHRLLMEELESLKASLRASQAAPVLYLGGNESVELVLDLGPIWQRQGADVVLPTAYSDTERPVAAYDR